jgi:hypothetical protein
MSGRNSRSSLSPDFANCSQVDSVMGTDSAPASAFARQEGLVLSDVSTRAHSEGESEGESDSQGLLSSTNSSSSPSSGSESEDYSDLEDSVASGVSDSVSTTAVDSATDSSADDGEVDDQLYEDQSGNVSSSGSTSRSSSDSSGDSRSHSSESGPLNATADRYVDHDRSHHTGSPISLGAEDPLGADEACLLLLPPQAQAQASPCPPHGLRACHH